MSGGLFGLLDHVAVLARLAAASIDDIGAAAGRATAKAAGVVIDDTAVTPQYVHRITAERELPIIKRIAIGSVRNKLLLILPGALLLSQLVPWLLTPLLMLGATYLCYEGAEKVCGVIGGRGHDAAPQVAERELVAGAIRTDFILSAEIMVIALNEVADQPFVPRLIVLVIVALVITAAVYGVVAVIRTTSACASPRPRPDSGSGSAGAWSRGCPNCYRRCQRSGWEPCSGWAAT
ncbi:integral membrane protein [Mycobacterium tuberculosis TKK_04_0067]|nr:integral membrane protein [Mycobacterium tuberculosis TKK_04_0067]KBY60307.1 integral membrane protein [Mycobacterium tuberculosis TKK-01-0022]KCC41731.1 integral membrane protein [Mycobacterium tuberculosis TKK_02_0025]